MKTVYFKYSKLAFFLISLINFIFFTGCAAHKPSVLELTPEINQQLVKKIRKSIISNENKIRSLKTNADIKVRSSFLRIPVKFNGILRYKRPNALRMVANKFSYTIFDMTYNSSQLSFYVPQERKIFLGAFDESTNIEVAGLTFKPYDIVNIFNFNEQFKDMEFSLEPYQESWIMHVYDTNHDSKRLFANLYISEENNITEYELFDYNGKPKTSINLDKFKELEGCNIPHKIEFKWPQNDTSFALTFSNLTVNQDLPDNMFNFYVPENTEIIPIGSWY